jgi:hypothetical protein
MHRCRLHRAKPIELHLDITQAPVPDGSSTGSRRGVAMSSRQIGYMNVHHQRVVAHARKRAVCKGHGLVGVCAQCINFIPASVMIGQYAALPFLPLL